MLKTVNAPHNDAVAYLAPCAVHDDDSHDHHFSINHHNSHSVGHPGFLPHTKGRVIDIGNPEPVSYGHVASEVSSHSEGPNSAAQHTNPDENSYHPAYFDSHSNFEDPKTASYCPTTTRTMNPIKNLILVTSPQWTCLQSLMFTIITTLTPRITATG